MLRSVIEVSGEQKLLSALVAALEPEKEDKNTRSSYTLELKDKLKIKIQAKDITSFRATINTITGLMAIVEKTWKL